MLTSKYLSSLVLENFQVPRNQAYLCALSNNLTANVHIEMNKHRTFSVTFSVTISEEKPLFLIFILVSQKMKPEWLKYPFNQRLIQKVHPESAVFRPTSIGGIHWIRSKTISFIRESLPVIYHTLLCRDFIPSSTKERWFLISWKYSCRIATVYLL